MKKRAVLFALSLLILLSACSNNVVTTDISVTTSSFIQSEEPQDMIEATFQEAQNINDKSWFGDEIYMRVVNPDEISPGYSIEMPMGLLGTAVPYPHDSEISRLTQIFFAHDIHESGESYSLLGIHLGDSFFDAEKRLLEEGYVLETELRPAYQNSPNIAKERYYTKYHITIKLELNGENEDTATIRYMSCVVVDPNTPPTDGAID